jgi:hypothetical protein
MNIGKVWLYCDDVDGKDLIKIDAGMFRKFHPHTHTSILLLLVVGLGAEEEDDLILSTTLCQDERLPT